MLETKNTPELCPICFSIIKEQTVKIGRMYKTWPRFSLLPISQEESEKETEGWDLIEGTSVGYKKDINFCSMECINKYNSAIVLPIVKSEDPK